MMPILRIEPHHFDLGAERRARGGEDFLEHPRVEEEGRPEIELEPVRLDRRGAAADNRQTLEDFHFTPAAASRMAEARPPGPAPMMMTSLLIDLVAGEGAGQNFVFTPHAEGAPTARGFESHERGRQREADAGDSRLRPDEDCADAHCEGAMPRMTRPFVSRSLRRRGMAFLELEAALSPMMSNLVSNYCSSKLRQILHGVKVFLLVSNLGLGIWQQWPLRSPSKQLRSAVG